MRKDIKILAALLSLNLVFIFIIFVRYELAIVLYPVFSVCFFGILIIEGYIFFRKKLVYKFDTIPSSDLYVYRFLGGIVSVVLIYILMFLTSLFIRLSGGKLAEMSMVFLALAPFWPAGAFLIGDRMYIEKQKGKIKN